MQFSSVKSIEKVNYCEYSEEISSIENVWTLTVPNQITFLQFGLSLQQLPVVVKQKYSE